MYSRLSKELERNELTSTASGENVVGHPGAGTHTISALHSHRAIGFGECDNHSDTDRESVASSPGGAIEMQNHVHQSKQHRKKDQEEDVMGWEDAKITRNKQESQYAEDDDEPEGQEFNDEDVEEEVELDELSPRNDKVKHLLKAAWPVITSFFLSIIGNFILMVFAGHAHEKNGLTVATVFAGVSLSNLFCNVTFRSLIIGMTGAMETLGSQNNGAGRYAEVGRTLHRSIFVLALTSLLSVGAWWNTENFFLLVGMDPLVSHVSGRYVRIRMLEMPISCFYESYEKYLMSIGVMRPAMYGNMALNVSVTIFCSFGIFIMHWDYRCLAASWVLSVCIALSVMLATSYKHPHVVRTSKIPWDWDSVLNRDKLRDFVNLGIPGTLMLCSEWWAYEILTVFAGRLGTNEVAAETIIMQLAALAFMLPLGLSVATASIIGNALGKGKRTYAMQMSHISLMTILTMELGVGVFLQLFGKIFCRTFTEDTGVLETTYELVGFLSLFCLIDGVQGVSSGVLRGAGQQAVGAITNIFSFYVLGLPCAWLLCFNGKFRVPGLMVGISAGTAFQVASLSFLIYRRPDYIFQTRIKGENGEEVIKTGAGASAGDARDTKFRQISDMDSSSAPLSMTLPDVDDDVDIGDMGDTDGESSCAASSYNKINFSAHVSVNVNDVDIDDDDGEGDEEQGYQTVSFTNDDIDTLRI